MISIFYGVAVVLSFVLLFVLYDMQGKKNAYFELAFLSILVADLGYLSISLSTVVEEAALANRFVYLGSCFLPPFLFMTLCELCRIKISKRMRNAMIVSSVVILLFASSTGYSRLYYKSVSLGHAYGGSYLIKEYGPLHMLYGIMLVLYMISMLVLVVYTYIKKRDVSHRTTMLLAVIVVANIGIYGLEQLAQRSVEWLPLAYFADELVLLIVYRRICMYDMANSIMLLDQQVENFGYITFDMKKHYLGCNQFAKDYFPELSGYAVDYMIPKQDSVFYKEVMEKLFEFEETGRWEDFFIQIGAHSLKCSIKYLHHGRKHRRIGYLVELTDDTRQQSFVRLLSKYNDDLESKVEEKTAHIRHIQDKIIVSMADMVESRDDNTGGHVKRTSECVRIFVEKLRQYPMEYPYSDTFFWNVIKAAPMHDLGKIAVDDSILRKPGRYTPEEYEEMKKHSAKGADIVRMVLENVEDEAFLETAVNVAHYHHEKWNGTGYPEGLKGEEIPVEARIMALADVFDALVSKRCYKEAYTYEKAFSIIEDSLGSHFDEKLGRVFMECRDELIDFYSQQEDEESETAVS